MKMKLKKLVDLSQVIGSIAIVGTLIFIGIQINQNTNATKASIRQSIATNDITYLSTFLNSEIIAEASAKHINNVELTAKEFEQMVWQQYVNFIVFETAYYNYREGFLEIELWDRYRFIIAGHMYSDPYAKKAWERFNGTFTASFQEEVKSIIREISFEDDSSFKFGTKEMGDSLDNRE
jgi:hypothetical protein